MKRADILARSVACTERARVYIDMDRKHWVSVVPGERERWPEHEDAVAALFERTMTTSPLARRLREGFTVRVVFGLEELREKLVIWQANLDDAVVECAKVHAVGQQPQLARAQSLIVDAVHDGALELVVDGAWRLVLPRELVARLSDDDRLPARFPELFGGRYVSLHRLLGPTYRYIPA